MKKILILITTFILSINLNAQSPVMVYGTTIGELFKTYYSLNNIEGMISITSKVSIDKFGEKNLKNLYQHMKFGYVIKRVGVNKNDDGTYTVVYKKNVHATNGRLTMQVAIENGQPKIIIQSLSLNNPFEL